MAQSTHTPAERRGARTLWIFVGVVLLGLAAASLLVLGGVGLGDKPSFLQDSAPQAAHFTPRRPASATRVQLAGSGTNLPLTRRLAVAFAEQQPRARVVVHESIGSRGGVRSAHDGVVDLGLISRSLTSAERRLGLQIIPYARVAVVVAANASVSEPGLTGAELAALYRGERRKWRDGTRVVVIQRERGDSSHLAVNRALDGFREANAQAHARGLWRVVYRDSTMQAALLSTVGAVGLLDLGAIESQHLPLKVLAVNGRRPARSEPLPPRYPFYKDLAFVSRGRPAGVAADFIRFVRSAPGQAIIRENGYLPLTRKGR